MPTSCSPACNIGFENVAAGLLACRKGWHPATRKKRRNWEGAKNFQAIPHNHTNSAGLEARLYVSQDG
jgi:hypothetical protein